MGEAIKFGRAMAAKIVKIKITTPPAKTTYETGETFSTAGMVVHAVYDNYTSEVITDYTVSPTGTLTTANTTVTVSYTVGGETFTATYPITVYAPKITFTIKTAYSGTKTYTARQGYTWAQWVNTSFNNSADGRYYIDGTNVISTPSYGGVYMLGYGGSSPYSSSGWTFCQKTDVIQAGKQYGEYIYSY